MKDLHSPPSFRYNKYVQSEPAVAFRAWFRSVRRESPRVIRRTISQIAGIKECLSLRSRGTFISGLAILTLLLGLSSAIAESEKPVSANTAPIPEYSVVVDAGHGGAIVRRADDRWDPISRKYLTSFLPGTMYTKYTEHELMLQLSKRVHHYLQLTQTDAGWKQFEGYLRKFSDQKNFVRIKFLLAL